MKIPNHNELRDWIENSLNDEIFSYAPIDEDINVHIDNSGCVYATFFADTPEECAEYERVMRACAWNFGHTKDLEFSVTKQYMDDEDPLLIDKDHYYEIECSFCVK